MKKIKRSIEMLRGMHDAYTRGPTRAQRAEYESQQEGRLTRYFLDLGEDCWYDWWTAGKVGSLVREKLDTDSPRFSDAGNIRIAFQSARNERWTLFLMLIEPFCEQMPVMKKYNLSYDVPSVQLPSVMQRELNTLDHFASSYLDRFKKRSLLYLTSTLSHGWKTTATIDDASATKIMGFPVKVEIKV
jgi:hypothetical protein